MNISPLILKGQYLSAHARWAFIADVERRYGLPAFLLFAVGSRETNLRNVIGDGGHGFGVFQRDNRSWHVGPSYLNDVRKQAEDAATLLKANYAALKDWKAACSAYNCGLGGTRKSLAAGHDSDYRTTGKDYGRDVMARRASLSAMFSTPVRPPAKPQPLYHFVKSGENLTVIAADFKTTVNRLVSLNHIANPDLLRVGQKLRVR